MQRLYSTLFSFSALPHLFEKGYKPGFSIENAVWRLYCGVCAVGGDRNQGTDKTNGTICGDRNQGTDKTNGKIREDLRNPVSGTKRSSDLIDVPNQQDFGIFSQETFAFYRLAKVY